MRDASRVNKVAVVVGTVTNDVRLFEVPKLTVSFIIRKIVKWLKA